MRDKACSFIGRSLPTKIYQVQIQDNRWSSVEKKNLKEEILLTAGPVRYSRGKLASSVTRGVSWPRWLLEGEVYLDLKVKVLHRHIDKARSRPLSCTRFSGSSDADGDAPSLLQILK